MAVLHQSDLAAWNRCAAQYRYSMEDQRSDQNSAAAFGSVMHHSLHILERFGDLDKAIETFLHYWHPLHIDAICESVPSGGWLPRQSYGGLRRRGVDTLRKYADLIRYDDHELLALEYDFVVPLLGTPHHLAGTVDRLAVRWVKRSETVCIDDYKLGAQKWNLRHNIQGTAYAYASTRPEFWTGAQVTDVHPSRGARSYVTEGFGVDRGDELFARFDAAPRKFTWINLQAYRWVDGGYRGPQDYERLRLAVEGVLASVDAGIFPLTIDGEVCTYCFRGEERYWTSAGLATFKETVGTEQMVLSNTGAGGRWVPARIESFGVQPLMAVNLHRGRARKTVMATAEHRWLKRVRTNRTNSVTVPTQELQPGDALSFLLPRASAKVQLSPFGVAAGVVFGDGCRDRKTSKVELFGPKRSLVSFFPGSSVTVGEGITRVHSLPAFFKDLPSLHEARSYLLGWLAGYFATDGSIHKNSGQMTLSSAVREHVEFAMTVAALVGIATYGLRICAMSRELNGTVYDGPQFFVTFVRSTIPEGFLVRPDQAACWRPTDHGAERLEWRVDSVEPTERVEEVFCAVVPEHGNFVLEDWINVENCPYRKTCGGMGLPDDDHGRWR